MKTYHKISKKMKNHNGVHLHYTGSMFGIGCSAFNENDVRKIRELKERNDSTGFIVLIPQSEWLHKFDIHVPKNLEKLLQQYWPGDLTVIFSTTENSFNHISVDGSVAFRIPQDEFLRDYILHSGSPIVSTSINISGERPENDLKTIENKFGYWFDFAVIPRDVTWVAGKPSTLIKYNQEIELIREGTIPFSQIKRSFEKPRILFVCTANICRSPMADYYMKKLIEKNNLSYDVRSAGFLDSDYQISENSRLTLLENGIDASKHISTQLDEEVVYASWLILTMTTIHKKNILERFPNAQGKTYTISEYSGFQQDIGDPFRMGIDEYRKTFNKIKKRCDVIFEKIYKEEA